MNSILNTIIMILFFFLKGCLGGEWEESHEFPLDSAEWSENDGDDMMFRVRGCLILIALRESN